MVSSQIPILMPALTVLAGPISLRLAACICKVLGLTIWQEALLRNSHSREVFFASRAQLCVFVCVCEGGGEDQLDAFALPRLSISSRCLLDPLCIRWRPGLHDFYFAVHRQARLVGLGCLPSPLPLPSCAFSCIACFSHAFLFRLGVSSPPLR